MKSILIVGVNGGMGKATASFLLEKGYVIYGIDCNDSSNVEGIKYFKVDITNINNIYKAYEIISNMTKDLYSIIHMAGIYMMESLLEISEEKMKKIFETNFLGVYRINKVFFPLLKKDSRIIITSSELAPLDPLPFNGIYSITKSTLEKYAFSLRMETNLFGIKVSLIRPGAVKTNLLNTSMKELDSFCENTLIHKESSKNFSEIVNHVESKSVSPIKVAKKAYIALNSKRPKYIYNLNRNCLLKLLNILPDRFQVFIIKTILNNKKH